MMPFQVTVAVLAFVAASLLAWLGLGTAIAGYHMVFAIGIVPLIFGAMIHFIPVLTRSGPAGRLIQTLPAVALPGGILAAGHFGFFPFTSASLYLGAATLCITVAAIANWAYRLKRKAIGSPHPCLDWYLAAMGCLFAALCAVMIGHLFPSHRASLRLLHLHLNTLGFIGITALGTVQVLLPTTVQKPDPAAAARMRTQLKLVMAGTVIIALAAALHSPMAWIGLILLSVSLISIITAWFKLYSGEIFSLHGAPPALAAAIFGYVTALAIGGIATLHRSAFSPVAVFIIAFLMPLVTGTVSYLLPLWLRPGRQTPWHQATRKYLGYGNGLRALLFLAAGIMAGLGYDAGWILSLFAAGTFLAQIVLIFILP